MWLLPTQLSWICSRGLEDSKSPSNNSDYDPEFWLTLSGKSTQRPFSWHGWKNREYRTLLFGAATWLTSTPDRLLEWTSSVVGHRASRSVPPGRDVALTMTGGSGLPSDGSSVTWDRDTCSWRTSPDLFSTGYLTSLPILPTSGSMRNGVCSPRPTLGPLTNGNDSGYSLWPTAAGMDSVGSGGNPGTTGTHGTTLTDRAVRMWGTPVARDDQKSPEAHLAMKDRMGGGRSAVTSLTVQVKMWPTPTARDTKGEDQPNPQGGMSLVNAACGRQSQTTPTDGSDGSPRADLNPRFVAALMGVPWDWLTLSISEGTDSSPLAPRTPSTSS